MRKRSALSHLFFHHASHTHTMAGLAEDVAGLVIEELKRDDGPRSVELRLGKAEQYAADPLLVIAPPTAPSTWPSPTPRRAGITACSRASTRTGPWTRRRRRRRRCGGWCGR